MSSATMIVRFANGDVRCGVYHGTVDMALPWLFTDLDDAWEQKRTQSRSWDEPYAADEVEEVEVFTFYGYGSWWAGHATRDLYVGPFGPDDIEELGACSDLDLTGAPAWVREWTAEAS